MIKNGVWVSPYAPFILQRKEMKSVKQCKTYYYKIDCTSAKPVTKDSQNRNVMFYKGDTVRFRIKVLEFGREKDLSDSFARLLVELPDGKVESQGDIYIRDPIDGDLEFIVDKKMMKYEGKEIDKESSYCTYIAQLEITGANGTILTDKFYYYILNSVGENTGNEDNNDFTPSIVGRAVVGKTVIGTIEEVEDVEFISEEETETVRISPLARAFNNL